MIRRIIAPIALALTLAIALAACSGSDLQPKDQSAQPTGVTQMSVSGEPESTPPPSSEDSLDTSVPPGAEVTGMLAPGATSSDSDGAVGGVIVWSPPLVANAPQPDCWLKDPIKGAEDSSDDSITVTVHDDLTLVDLQQPAKLWDLGLVGIVLGGDFVAIPDFMFEAETSTISLGGDFSNRKRVYACYGR